MKRACLLLVTLGTLACRPAPSASSAPSAPRARTPARATVERASMPAPTQVADGTYALVWWNAALHRAPRVDAPIVRAARLQSREPGQVQTVKVLAEIGDWLEIETLGSSVGVCHPAAAPLDGVRGRLFVRVSDVASATTQTMHQRFADSSVEIHAGTHAVRARSDARANVPTFLLGGDGVAITVELPASDVGRYFRNDRPVYPSRAALRLVDAPTIGGLPIVDLRTSRDPMVGFCGAVRPRYVTGSAATPPPLPPPRARPAAGRLVGPQRTTLVRSDGCRECVAQGGYRTTSVRVPGPPIFWEDGTAAGISHMDVELDDIAPSPTTSGQLCFAIRGAQRVRRLHAPEERSLRLCAEKAAIHPPRP